MITRCFRVCVMFFSWSVASSAFGSSDPLLEELRENSDGAFDQCTSRSLDALLRKEGVKYWELEGVKSTLKKLSETDSDWGEGDHYYYPTMLERLANVYLGWDRDCMEHFPRMMWIHESLKPIISRRETAPTWGWEGGKCIEIHGVYLFLNALRIINPSVYEEIQGIPGLKTLSELAKSDRRARGGSRNLHELLGDRENSRNALFLRRVRERKPELYGTSPTSERVTPKTELPQPENPIDVNSGGKTEEDPVDEFWRRAELWRQGKL